jgi:hypothetical protein
MRKIFFAQFLILAALPVYAEQQVPVNIQGGGAADLLNMNTTPPALQDSHANDDGVRHFCTDRYGRIVQQADPNYNDCLRNKKADVAAPMAAQTPTGALPTAAIQPTAAERSAAKAAGGAP